MTTIQWANSVVGVVQWDSCGKAAAAIYSSSINMASSREMGVVSRLTCKRGSQLLMYDFICMSAWAVSHFMLCCPVLGQETLGGQNASIASSTGASTVSMQADYPGSRGVSFCVRTVTNCSESTVLNSMIACQWLWRVYQRGSYGGPRTSHQYPPKVPCWEDAQMEVPSNWQSCFHQLVLTMLLSLIPTSVSSHFPRDACELFKRCINCHCCWMGTSIYTLTCMSWQWLSTTLKWCRRC